jgi:hypothetical protein
MSFIIARRNQRKKVLYNYKLKILFIHILSVSTFILNFFKHKIIEIFTLNYEFLIESQEKIIDELKKNVSGISKSYK